MFFSFFQMDLLVLLPLSLTRNSKLSVEICLSTIYPKLTTQLNLIWYLVHMGVIKFFSKIHKRKFKICNFTYLTDFFFLATVMENGTLSWKAMSNLIADSWSELFIIKAKGKLIFFISRLDFSVWLLPFIAV